VIDSQRFPPIYQGFRQYAIAAVEALRLKFSKVAIEAEVAVDLSTLQSTDGAVDSIQSSKGHG